MEKPTPEACDTELLIGVFNALEDTARRTTDLESVYNDTCKPSDPNSSFTWEEVEQAKRVMLRLASR